MKKHFLVVFSFPELLPVLFAESLPISIIQKQTENRYGLQPDHVVLLLTCKFGLHQFCKPDGLALYITDENTINAIKGSASKIFDLRHSFVVKLGEEMEEQTEKGDIQ